MTDHKFEPFQKVLVRNADDEKWKADFYSHHRSENWPYQCAGDVYKQCILYTPETAHLIGTSQPYEPPKPPVDEYQRFKCGEWVEVLYLDKWVKALFLFYNGAVHCAHVPSGNKASNTFDPDQIRPLQDDTAHLDAKP